MSSAPEGWYVDPSTGTNLRRWNGYTWTDEVAPLPPEPVRSGPVDVVTTAAPETSVPDTSAASDASAAPDAPATSETTAESDPPTGPDTSVASDTTVTSDTTAESDPPPASETFAASDPPTASDTTATSEPPTPDRSIAATAPPAADAAEILETETASEPAPTANTAETPDTVPDDSEPAESIPGAQPDQAAEGGISVEGGLDPEIELTQLTRRELRARRGVQVVPDDTPKHLPLMTPAAFTPIEQWATPAEENEIPSPPAAQEEPEDADPERHRRIVRLSVLLGVLAIVSSIAVLTAGTI